MKKTRSHATAALLTLACALPLHVCSSNSVGTVTGSGATRDVTVSLTSGTGGFKLRVID